MYLPLETAVNATVINAAGAVVGLGGLLLAGVWLKYLYR
jgi:hypothetical protein